MTNFDSMRPLTEVAVLNTPEALDYFWSHVDEGYFTSRASFYQEVVEGIERYCPTPQCLLDVGSGPGPLLAFLVKRYPRAELTVLDSSQEAVNQVSRKYHDDPHISTIWGDITQTLTWAGKYYDTITCIECLEHIKDYPAALANMMRLLRPGGHLILTVPNNDNWKGHVNHWTQDAFLGILSEYGEATVELFHEGHNLIGHVVK